MKTTRRNTTSKANKNTARKNNVKNKKSVNMYREGNEVYLSPEEVDANHEQIIKKQTNKHISKEKLFGRLGRIGELEVKCARIRAGQSFLAIAQ